MRVKYTPKGWKPKKQLDQEIRALFTLLHVIEPIEGLTLNISKADRVSFTNGEESLAAFHCPDNEIILPAYDEQPLHNLLHEYQHAIDQRNGIDRDDHRGFPQKMNKLFRRLMEET